MYSIAATMLKTMANLRRAKRIMAILAVVDGTSVFNDRYDFKSQ